MESTLKKNCISTFRPFLSVHSPLGNQNQDQGIASAIVVCLSYSSTDCHHKNSSDFVLELLKYTSLYPCTIHLFMQRNCLFVSSSLIPHYAFSITVFSSIALNLPKCGKGKPALIRRNTVEDKSEIIACIESRNFAKAARIAAGRCPHLFSFLTDVFTMNDCTSWLKTCANCNQ